jgi:hypothetical protein
LVSEPRATSRFLGFHGPVTSKCSALNAAGMFTLKSGLKTAVQSRDVKRLSVINLLKKSNGFQQPLAAKLAIPKVLSDAIDLITVESFA